MTDLLAGITVTSREQQTVIEHLWRMTGKCCGCRKTLVERSPKMAMAVINTSFCLRPELRNTIGISLYCGPCTDAINAVLKQLRPAEVTH